MFLISVHSIKRLSLEGFLSSKVPWSDMDEYESIHIGNETDLSSKYWSYLQGGQMAEWIWNWAINQKVAGSRPCKMTLCPWARHFTLFALGECPCTDCKSLWISASAKSKCNRNYTDRVNIQRSQSAKSHFREIYCPPLPPAPQQRGVDFGCLNISVFTFL